MTDSFSFLYFFAKLFCEKLARNKFFVGPIHCNQLIMGTNFLDFTLLEDNNLVGIPDGRKSVSDDNASLLSILHQSIEGCLYLMLTFCVKCASCLVQKYDLGLSDEGSGDGDALLLAS